MKLSHRLDAFLREVEKAERTCRFYEPKDPARGAHFRLAADGYGGFAEQLATFMDQYGLLLVQAEAAELVAESDEVRP